LRTSDFFRYALAAKEWKSLRRGWGLGDEQFRNELLEQALQISTDQHCAVERQEGTEEKAQRIIREERAALGWAANDLRNSRKGDENFF